MRSQGVEDEIRADWQQYEGAVLPGLADVIAVFAPRGMAPLAIADYFLSESDELGDRRPLDLLRENRVAEVRGARKTLRGNGGRNPGETFWVCC